MQWTQKNVVANEGIIFVQREVNKHGSIFRPVHQETDIGIDAFIEYVESENATGQLIAVQVKSGDSYLNSKADKFVLTIDEKHIAYWNEFSVPVMLIFYSPTLNKAAFVEIKSLVAFEKYHDRLPITKIEVSIEHKIFDSETLSTRVKEILKVYSDEKILLDAVENCLGNNIQKQKDGFLILSNHPFSRARKITVYIARQLIMTPEIELAKNALFTLGYGAGRQRWSWNPNNVEEKEVIQYASEVCASLKEIELRRVISLIEGEHWSGPDGLGERAIDVLSCNDNSALILDEILYNTDYSTELRAFCLYLLYDCDMEFIIRHKKKLVKLNLKEVYEWIVA